MTCHGIYRYSSSGFCRNQYSCATYSTPLLFYNCNKCHTLDSYKLLLVISVVDHRWHVNTIFSLSAYVGNMYVYRLLDQKYKKTLFHTLIFKICFDGLGVNRKKAYTITTQPSSIHICSFLRVIAYMELYNFLWNYLMIDISLPVPVLPPSDPHEELMKRILQEQFFVFNIYI